VALLPRDALARIRWVALGASLLTFLLALKIFLDFSPNHPWDAIRRAPTLDRLLRRLAISGYRRFKPCAILLAAFLTPSVSCLLGEYHQPREGKFLRIPVGPRDGMIGVFVSLDLSLFHFWKPC